MCQVQADGPQRFDHLARFLGVHPVAAAFDPRHGAEDRQAHLAGDLLRIAEMAVEAVHHDGTQQ